MAAHFFETVENTVTGKPVANATIEVFTSAAVITGSLADGYSVTGTHATIYSDDGVTEIDQDDDPLTADSSGFFEFWTAESSVVILISYDGQGRRAISDVDLIGSSVNSDIAALGTRVTATEVITQDATIVAFKGLTGAADKVPYFTGVDTMALADFTSFGRSLVDDAAASNARTTLGLGTSAVIDTGTSGTKVALTDGANTWSGAQTDSALATFSAGANITPAATPATNAVGYLGSPQMSDQDDYTLVMSDAGKHYYHVSASPHTLTIPANASVAFPIGTVFAIINANGAGDLTVAITSDTLRWADQTGSRTIAANGTATLIKVTSTTWRMTGDEIT